MVTQDKDWLGLGQRRVQHPGISIGPNQLFGIVYISSLRNPNLDDQASREGLKENEAYRALQACVLAFKLGSNRNDTSSVSGIDLEDL